MGYSPRSCKESDTTEHMACGVSYKRCHVSQSGIWPAELKTVPFGYILDGVSIELLF